MQAINQNTALLLLVCRIIHCTINQTHGKVILISMSKCTCAAGRTGCAPNSLLTGGPGGVSFPINTAQLCELFWLFNIVCRFILQRGRSGSEAVIHLNFVFIFMRGSYWPLTPLSPLPHVPYIGASPHPHHPFYICSYFRGR